MSLLKEVKRTTALTSAALMFFFGMPELAEPAGRRGGGLSSGSVGRGAPSGPPPSRIDSPATTPAARSTSPSGENAPRGDTIRSRQSSQSTTTPQRTTAGGRKVMTAPQARSKASRLAYKETKKLPPAMRRGKRKVQKNALVFKGKLPNTNVDTYISPDTAGHRFDNGWKVWNKRGSWMGHANQSLTTLVR